MQWRPLLAHIVLTHGAAVDQGTHRPRTACLKNKKVGNKLAMKALSGQSSGGTLCRCRKELERRSQLQRGVMPAAISPLSLRVLFRFPCSGYMPGGLIAELLNKYVEGDVVNVTGSEPKVDAHDTPDVQSRARAAASQARRNLRRLMPFEQWCARIGPTEAAKELYVYVRSRLEEGAANTLRQSRCGSRKKKNS